MPRRAGLKGFSRGECLLGKYHLLSCTKSWNITLEFLEFWLYGQSQIKRSVLCYYYLWPCVKSVPSKISSSLSSWWEISPQNHLQCEKTLFTISWPFTLTSNQFLHRLIVFSSSSWCLLIISVANTSLWYSHILFSKILLTEDFRDFQNIN